MSRLFDLRLAMSRLLVAWLLIPALSLSAQNSIEFTAKTSYANWGSRNYNLDGLGRGSGWSLCPGVVFHTGKFVLTGEGEWGRYNFEPSLFQYVFYNGDGERILWQSEDALLRPTRKNFEIGAGIAWGHHAVLFLTTKVTAVRFSQYVAVDQFQYNTSAGTWNRITDAPPTGKYSQSESHTWLGFGCMFQLPVWYRQFTLDGTVKYYVFNQERFNVLYGEALLSRRLNRVLTLSAGGRMEMLTSGELLGSIWSLTLGLSYHVPLTS